MNDTDTTAGAAFADAHLDDERLVALLDGEPGGDRQAWRRHLSSCPGCRDDYARLEAHAAVVSGWFAAAEPAQLEPPPASRRRGAPDRARRARPGWPGVLLKAAAVLLLVAAPAVAFPGIRDRVRRGGRDGTEPAGSPAAAPVRPSGSTLRFAPSGGELVVRLADGVEGGGMTVLRGAGAEVVVEIASAGTSATVSEAGLTLRGSGGPASITVRVPASVGRVLVLGLRTPVAVDVDALAGPALVELVR